MKNCYRNILFVSAAMMVAAACSKTHTEDGPNELMPISVSAVDGTATKSLLDGEKFNTPGNRILIYDFVDNGTEPYFSDLIGPDVKGSPLAQATEGVWPFVNGPHQWTPGTHKFFGWLVNDANGTGGVTSDDLSPAGLFGESFNYVTGTEKNVTMAAFNLGTKTLSIPATTISQTSPQFDFMYSNVVSTEPQVDPVDLTFSHLFSAFSIGALNETQNSTIIIKKFEILGLYNSAGASIEFEDKDNNGISSVKYDNYTQNYLDSNTDKVYAAWEGENSLTKEKPSVVNIFDPTDTEKEYQIIWPQIYRSLYPLGQMRVSYSYEGSDEVITSTVNFPDVDWEAGKKYHFDIIFNKDPGSVWVTYIVADWDDVEWNLEFEAPLHTFLLTEPIDEADEPTVDPAIYYDNSTSSGENGAFVGYFKMDSPDGITWKPTLTRGSAADYEVRVYTNKDNDGSIHENYDILVTEANIPAETGRFYKIVVVAKNPDNIGKVVKLGMTYAPLWNQDANPLLIINKGDNSSFGTYYPWDDDDIANNDPDECWISIKQIAKPIN